MQEKPGGCHKPYIALLGKSLAGSQGPLCTFCTHDNKQHRHLTLTSVCLPCPFTPFIVDENLLMHVHTDSARHRHNYGLRIKPSPRVTARLDVRKLSTVVQSRTEFNHPVSPPTGRPRGSRAIRSQSKQQARFPPFADFLSSLGTSISALEFAALDVVADTENA